MKIDQIINEEFPDATSGFKYDVRCVVEDCNNYIIDEFIIEFANYRVGEISEEEIIQFKNRFKKKY